MLQTPDISQSTPVNPASQTNPTEFNGLNQDQSHAKSPIKTRFSSENARLMAQRAIQARLAKKQAKIKAEQEAQSAALDLAQNPVKSPVGADDGYVMDRLERVRKQIDQLDSMIQAACSESDIDSAMIDKLTSALSRLSDIEQKLAGRPSPGSLRPTDKPSQSRASLLLGLNPDKASTKRKIEQE